MPIKKTTRLTDIQKNKIYKLYTQHNFSKKELATEYDCTLSVIKNLIANFSSPLYSLRLQSKKTGSKEPICFANESWKKICYSTRTKYEVSNHGRVRSYYPDATIPVISRGILQAGYLFLDYFNTEEKRRIKVPFHVLVADHFLKKSASEQNRVIHLDYKKVNNRTSNLKWGTDEELYAHNNKNPEVALSRQKSNAERTTGTKLNLVQVERIRKLLKDPARKVTKERIAAMYGIAPMTLYRIQSGEIWAAKGNPLPYQKKPVIRLDAKSLNDIKIKLLQTNAVQSVIAKEYGVSPTVINRIKQGKTYKN